MKKSLSAMMGLAILIASTISAASFNFAQPFSTGLHGSISCQWSRGTNDGTDGTYVKENAWDASSLTQDVNTVTSYSLLLGGKYQILPAEWNDSYRIGFSAGLQSGITNLGTLHDSWSHYYSDYLYTVYYDLHYTAVQIPLVLTASFDFPVIKSDKVPVVISIIPKGGMYVTMPTSKVNRDYWWTGSYEGNSNEVSTNTPSPVIGYIAGGEIDATIGSFGTVFCDYQYSADLTKNTMDASTGTTYSIFKAAASKWSVGIKYQI